MIDQHHTSMEQATGQDWTDAPTAGIDWASTDHAVAIVDHRGNQVERFTITHTTSGLRELVRRLRRAGVVEVAIERPDGPVVDALLEAGVGVVVIAPNQLKNLRSRYGSAGNKDDRFDAYVLADTLRTDRARLRPLTRDSDATMTLRMTVRARQDLVKARVAMANQLRAHLQTTFPGAIGLFRDIDSAISLRFLTRFPGQDKAEWLSSVRLGNWLRSVGYNHLANLDRMWAHLDNAPRGTTGTEATAQGRDHPGARRDTHGSADPDQDTRGPDRRPARSPPRRRDLYLAAQVRHRPRGPASGRDRRRPRQVPHARSVGLPSRRSTLDQAVGQGQSRRLPMGRRQTAPRRSHRLRRRLPPRQPLGRRPLQPRPSTRSRPPPRRPDPRPSLAPHHLAMLARPRALQPRQTPRTTTTPTAGGLTQG